jgi:xylose isomerase
MTDTETATADTTSKRRERSAMPKIAVALDVFGTAPDRFNPTGYREETKLQERLSSAAKVKGVKGVEISQSDISADIPAKEVKRILREYGLACAAVTSDPARDARFALAGFAHQHSKTRNAAIDDGRRAVDTARILGATELTLRLYSDGFDYPFHVDYATHWSTLISSIKTIAKYATPDINVAVAYKPREPRKFLSVGSVGKALSLCQEIAMKNVGVSLDFGHAMMAGENPADSIAFLARSNKLFQVYFSENYRQWDDALIPGTVHLWELMESLFYLKSVKYRGFITVKMEAPRTDPIHACQVAVGNMNIMWKKLERIDAIELRKAQKTLDAIETQKLIRRAMLQG